MSWASGLKYAAPPDVPGLSTSTCLARSVADLEHAHAVERVRRRGIVEPLHPGDLGGRGRRGEDGEHETRGRNGQHRSSPPPHARSVAAAWRRRPREGLGPAAAGVSELSRRDASAGLTGRRAALTRRRAAVTRRSPGRNARPATARGRRRRLRRRRRRRSRGRGRRRFGRPGAGAGGPARVARAGGLARSAGGAGRCRFAGVRSLASAGRAGTAGVSPRIGAGRSGAAIGPASGRRSRRVAGVPCGVVAARLPGAGVPRSRSRGPRGDGIGDDRAYRLVGADPGRSGDQRQRHQLERRRAGQRGAPHDHSGGADGAPRAARANAGTTPEDVLEHGRSGERRERGCEQGECGPAAADRLLEVLARLAATEVGADLAPAQQAQVGRGDPLAHEVAAHLVAIPQLVQGRACLVDELLAAGLRGAERRCDLRRS